MKKCLFVVLLVLILSEIWCLYEAYEYKKESDWFCELSDEWHLFEADYTEDIKNIDRLRDDKKNYVWNGNDWRWNLNKKHLSIK